MQESMLPSRRFVRKLSSDSAFWALGLLIILACAFGGGSRHDIAELTWLRSATALILAFGLWGLSKRQWNFAARPIILILGLAGIMIVQLVPLPASIWGQLPGRELIAELDQLAGLGDIWRPITLSPSATWNALASLIVPLTALILMARLTEEAWSVLPLVILAVGVISAALGIIQVLSGAPEALYFYDVTNQGSAVGLFANRNHNGVLSAVSLLIVLWYLSDRTDQFPPLRYAVWIAMALFLLAGIMVNGSRAGLLCTLLALGLVAIARLSRPSQEGETSISAARRIAPIVLGTGVVLGTIALFVAGDRSTAAARLFGEDPTQGMRWESATTSLALAWDNLIFGVGFGAFESAYRMVEPRELLNPYYLNEAHNDWLQFVIEGGLTGLLVLVLGGAMVAHGLATKRHEDDRIVLAFLIFIILAAASIVDYPLRTPLMMIIAAWIAFAFGRKSSTANRN